MSKSRSWIWKYICEVEKKKKYKCNLCYKNFHALHYNELKYHLYHCHEILNEDDIKKWKNNTNNLIWQYFSKQDGYAACCKNCNKLIMTAFNVCDLVRHLNSAHKHIINAKREIIEQTWLSPHIIFKDWRVLCKQEYCSYRTSVFQKIDVLKFHLDECHNINTYSGCEERTEDSKAEEMIQQSVDKTNCASSHHDNTQKQPLKNQESLQGYQHNGQVSESHKIWKPYI